MEYGFRLIFFYLKLRTSFRLFWFAHLTEKGMKKTVMVSSTHHMAMFLSARTVAAREPPRVNGSLLPMKMLMAGTLRSGFSISLGVTVI